MPPSFRKKSDAAGVAFTTAGLELALSATPAISARSAIDTPTFAAVNRNLMYSATAVPSLILVSSDAGGVCRSRAPNASPRSVSLQYHDHPPVGVHPAAFSQSQCRVAFDHGGGLVGPKPTDQTDPRHGFA